MSDSHGNENGARPQFPLVSWVVSTDNTGFAVLELDPTLDFIAGTVAGVSGLVVGFPFDTGERLPTDQKRGRLLKTRGTK